MAQEFNVVRLGFLLGCAALMLAFLDKIFTLTTVGLNLAIRTRVAPHNFLEASVVFFVLAIAGNACASARARG